MPDLSTYTLTIGDESPVAISSPIVDMSSESIPYDAPTVRPDQQWTFTDPLGHTHRWVLVADEWTLPTLTEVTVQCDGACGDPEHEVVEYRCAECGYEDIEPKWAYGRKTGYLPGLQSMTMGFTAEADIVTRRDPSKRLENVVIHKDGRPHITGSAHVADYSIRTRASIQRIYTECKVKLDFIPVNDPEGDTPRNA